MPKIHWPQLAWLLFARNCFSQSSLFSLTSAKSSIVYKWFQGNKNTILNWYVRRTPNSLQIWNKRCAHCGRGLISLFVKYWLYSVYTHMWFNSILMRRIRFSYWFPTGGAVGCCYLHVTLCLFVYELVSSACQRAKVSHFEINLKTTKEAKTTRIPKYNF